MRQVPATDVTEPETGLPPSRTLHVAGRGNFAVRDSGGTGVPVLLLHGFLCSADTNWHATYGSLVDAGYRVLAFDHRGHGRGMRGAEPFRLVDCADDAAGVIRAAGCGPVVAVGYSMGGAVTQLLALRHPELLRGMVLSSTACEFADLRIRLLQPAIGLLPLVIGAWRLSVRLAGLADDPLRVWFGAELSNSDPADLVEAGHELCRYDSRPWIRSVDVPAAVMVTTSDLVVLPSKQFELAAALRAATYRIDGDHFTVTTRSRLYCAVLLQALATLVEDGEQEVALAA